MPLPISSVFPPPSAEFLKWPSRRSVVHSTKGIVACTQPLAAKCGIDILNKGGNAADAAVAVAAAMNMTEPCATGIGGDMFVLYYDAATKKVSALNGSGRSGAKSTLEAVRSGLRIPDGQLGKVPLASAYSVTVPGTAAGWVDTVERFGSGKLGLPEILAPAIELGEKGFPVSELTAHWWAEGEQLLRDASPNFGELLKDDSDAPDGVRAPRAGEIMRNAPLAATFRAVAAEGKAGFYTGRVAAEMVAAVRDRGGLLELADLQHHLDVGGSEAVAPISLRFAGLDVWEHPPNGQGIVALMALGIVRELQAAGTVPAFGPADHNTAPYLHAVVEALRIAFADGTWFVTDPAVVPVPVDALLSPAYLRQRAALFDPARASGAAAHGSPALSSSDTTYFSVSDAAGNAASFIQSNYAGFGTGIVPRGCGFTLQNRGANFSLSDKHPNVMAPRKRPYHTIIPGLVTNAADGSLHSVFGVMGGFMQPQGHVQVLLGQAVGGLSPQQALDAPRVCIGPALPEEDGEEGPDLTVHVEEGMPEETVEGLRRLGHRVEVVTGAARAMFGRGQVIRWSVDPVDGQGVWSAGSDLRGDGAAYPA